MVWADGARGNPREIIAKLHKGVAASLQDKNVRDLFESSGAEPVGYSLEEFSPMVKTELVKWAKVVQVAGIKPE